MRLTILLLVGPASALHWDTCKKEEDCKSEQNPRCFCDKMSFIEMSLEREGMDLEREEGGDMRPNFSLYKHAPKSAPCVLANQEAWAIKDHGADWYAADLPGCCVGSCGDPKKPSRMAGGATIGGIGNNPKKQELWTPNKQMPTPRTMDSVHRGNAGSALAVEGELMVDAQQRHIDENGQVLVGGEEHKDMRWPLLEGGVYGAGCTAQQETNMQEQTKYMTSFCADTKASQAVFQDKDLLTKWCSAVDSCEDAKGSLKHWDGFPAEPKPTEEVGQGESVLSCSDVEGNLDLCSSPKYGTMYEMLCRKSCKLCGEQLPDKTQVDALADRLAKDCEAVAVLMEGDVDSEALRVSSTSAYFYATQHNFKPSCIVYLYKPEARVPTATTTATTADQSLEVSGPPKEEEVLRMPGYLGVQSDGMLRMKTICETDPQSQPPGLTCWANNEMAVVSKLMYLLEQLSCRKKTGGVMQRFLLNLVHPEVMDGVAKLSAGGQQLADTHFSRMLTHMCSMSDMTAVYIDSMNAAEMFADPKPHQPHYYDLKKLRQTGCLDGPQRKFFAFARGVPKSTTEKGSKPISSPMFSEEVFQNIHDVSVGKVQTEGDECYTFTDHVQDVLSNIQGTYCPTNLKEALLTAQSDKAPTDKLEEIVSSCKKEVAYKIPFLAATANTKLKKQIADQATPFAVGSETMKSTCLNQFWPMSDRYAGDPPSGLPHIPVCSCGPKNKKIFWRARNMRWVQKSGMVCCSACSEDTACAHYLNPPDRSPQPTAHSPEKVAAKAKTEEAIETAKK